MKLELIIFGITAFILHNIYTEGKTIKMAMKYKKYYHMIAIATFAFFLYYLFKYNPKKIDDVVLRTQDYIKYLPMDSHTSSIINPILDFTKKHNYFRSMGTHTEGLIPVSTQNDNLQETITQPIKNYTNPQQSAKTKRSVSETKKKWVAYRQEWRCAECRKMLPAWFEVDHITRLEHGGSNDVNNLRALCRDCHGKKTAMENL